MLTAAQIKFIRSLQKKKFRDEHGLFVAEGEKLVNDLLAGDLLFNGVFYTSDWNAPAQSKYKNYLRVTHKEMERMSGLATPSSVLAIVEYPNLVYNHHDLFENLTLVLDGVQDPGNLGTILRLASWFGIEHILCSSGTADVFAPKVVQASMGAIAHVKVVYCDLPLELAKCKNLMPIYGTFMEGENVYQAHLGRKGCIVMGNEGSGISREVEALVTKRLKIPSFTKSGTTESLNVAVATAIVCSEFRRRQETLP